MMATWRQFFQSRRETQTQELYWLNIFWQTKMKISSVLNLEVVSQNKVELSASSIIVNLWMSFFKIIFPLFSPILNQFFSWSPAISNEKLFAREIYGVVYDRNHKFFHFISIFFLFHFLSLRIISSLVTVFSSVLKVSCSDNKKWKGNAPWNDIGEWKARKVFHLTRFNWIKNGFRCS